MSGMPESARLEQARAAIAQGAPWRARDLLVRHLDGHRDPEALTLLGEVYQGMGDLPDASIDELGADQSDPDAPVSDNRTDADHPGGDDEGGLDAAKFIAWLAAAAFVACGVIGLVTVLQWLVPG